MPFMNALAVIVGKPIGKTWEKIKTFCLAKSSVPISGAWVWYHSRIGPRMGKGGWGCSTNAYTGRLRPKAQPLTLLCTSFDRKGTPFVYPLLTNGTPFTYLVKNIASLLTTVNALSFKQESVTKIEPFLDFIKP